MQVISIVVALTFAFIGSTAAEQTIEGYWGDWDPRQYIEKCKSPAIAFATKSEPVQGGGDDSALNAIAFMCKNGEQLRSLEGPWGRWTDWKYCPPGSFIKGVGLTLENPKGNGDDTAANQFKVKCYNKQSDKFGYILADDTREWGDAWYYAECDMEKHFGVVGFITRVERDQESGDDTALNGIKLFCGLG